MGKLLVVLQIADDEDTACPVLSKLFFLSSPLRLNLETTADTIRAPAVRKQTAQLCALIRQVMRRFGTRAGECDNVSSTQLDVHSRC